MFNVDPSPTKIRQNPKYEQLFSWNLPISTCDIMSLVHTLSYLVFCTNETSTHSSITTLKAPFYYFLLLSSCLSCLVFWKKTSTHRLLATLKAKVPWARLAIAAIASSFTHIALIGWEPNLPLLARCKHDLRKGIEIQIQLQKCKQNMNSSKKSN